MVKISTKYLLDILRRYHEVGEDSSTNQIDQLRITHPRQVNTLASFRYKKQSYFVLLDETAEDNERYLMAQLETLDREVDAQLVPSPIDPDDAFAIPHKGKDVYLFRATNIKKRLDIHLGEKYPEKSRSFWKKQIDTGKVSVGGIVKTSANFQVGPSDAVSIEPPTDEPLEKATIPVLYEDDNVVVIDKPIGVLSHAKTEIEEYTVADFFKGRTTYQSGTNRPGIVHRLDRATSGVMIGAKNPETGHKLMRQFSERKTKKVYVAIVDGTPKNPQAKIDLPLARSISQPSKFVVDAAGKPAITVYKVLTSQGGRSLVLLRPETGRTHQLRVHMSYIGTPIIGDRLYGKPASRLFLHALCLEITIPTSERRTFCAALPSEFTKYFKNAETLLSDETGYKS